MLLEVRVGDSFVAEVNNFAQGVVFAVDSGARVVQEALGTLNQTRFGQQAIDYAYQPRRRGDRLGGRRGVEPPQLSRQLQSHGRGELGDALRRRQRDRADAALVPVSERLHQLRRAHRRRRAVVELLVGGDRPQRRHGRPDRVGGAQRHRSRRAGAVPARRRHGGAVPALGQGGQADPDQHRRRHQLRRARRRRAAAAGELHDDDRHPGHPGQRALPLDRRLRSVLRLRAGQRRPRRAAGRGGTHSSRGRDRRAELVRDRRSGERADPLRARARRRQPRRVLRLRHRRRAGHPAGGGGLRPRGHGERTRIGARGRDRHDRHRDACAAACRTASRGRRSTTTARPIPTASRSPCACVSWTTWATRRGPPRPGPASRPGSHDRLSAPARRRRRGRAAHRRPRRRRARGDHPRHLRRRGARVSRRRQRAARLAGDTDPIELHDQAPGYASGAVPSPVYGAVLGGVAVGDLDRDGTYKGALDVVATDLQGKLYVWGPDGTRRDGFPVSTLPEYSFTHRSERDLGRRRAACRTASIATTPTTASAALSPADRRSAISTARRTARWRSSPAPSIAMSTPGGATARRFPGGRCCSRTPRRSRASTRTPTRSR